MPIQPVTTDKIPPSRNPFSLGIKANGFLFVSGQIGNVPGKVELATGGLRAEARQVLENVTTVVGRHGSSLDHIVKCTVFLADMHEWAAFNDVYREFFSRNLPARSALGANGLALGASVEMECIAYVPPSR